jgi:hypothetical protein
MLVGTAKRVGPARTAFYVYERVPRGRSGPASPAGGTDQPPPPSPRRPSRTYDVEGTATEVPDDPGELGSGEDRRDG